MLRLASRAATQTCLRPFSVLFVTRARRTSAPSLAPPDSAWLPNQGSHSRAYPALMVNGPWSDDLRYQLKNRNFPLTGLADRCASGHKTQESSIHRPIPWPVFRFVPLEGPLSSVP
jgi:hypothetical protein